MLVNSMLIWWRNGNHEMFIREDIKVLNEEDNVSYSGSFERWTTCQVKKGFPMLPKLSFDIFSSLNGRLCWQVVQTLRSYYTSVSLDLAVLSLQLYCSLRFYYLEQSQIGNKWSGMMKWKQVGYLIFFFLPNVLTYASRLQSFHKISQHRPGF